jgi:hypothetical protein
MGELAFGGSFNAMETEGHPIMHWIDTLLKLRFYVSVRHLPGYVFVNGSIYLMPRYSIRNPLLEIHFLSYFYPNMPKMIEK